MIKITHRGDFKNTERFLNKAKNMRILSILRSYGSIGVNALSAATPSDSGITASSWDYSIIVNRNGYKLSWFNTNVKSGVPIAILIQYGHGTGTGGYVPPRDFINPAIQPIMDKISADIQREVSSL